jgi:hypothetical protein
VRVLSEDVFMRRTTSFLERKNEKKTE